MIRRAARPDGTVSEARYSACGTYRYLLSRRWSAGPGLLFVMLNPSTATEAANDPTVERCERRARAMGHGSLVVANLFALRATDPADLRRAADPVGPENDAALRAATDGAGAILCAWGTHGAYLGRNAAVLALLRDTGLPLVHLGLTRAGHPRHPLYVAYARAPLPWT